MQEITIFLPMHEAVGLLCLLHFYLCAQDWECTLLTPFSARNLSMLVEISHYFSSYIPPFRVWTKAAALHMHSSVQTCFSSLFGLHCWCFAANGFLHYKRETLKTPCPDEPGSSQLDFCTILHHFQDKSVQFACGSGYYQNQTQNHAVEWRSGDQCLLQWLVLQGLFPILWQLML